MATCTPVYGLPYAEGDDAPCDIDETLCAFAEAVEAQLDVLDAVVDRTADTVPMVQVKLTAPFTFTATGNLTATVPFDTISFDTANFVSLADNAFQVTLPRAGRYLTSFQVQIASVPVGDIVYASTSINLPYDQYVSDASTPVYLNGASEIRYAPGGSGQPVDTFSPVLTFTLQVLPGTFIVEAVTLCICWIGDIP